MTKTNELPCKWRGVVVFKIIITKSQIDIYRDSSNEGMIRIRIGAIHALVRPALFIIINNYFMIHDHDIMMMYHPPHPHHH